MAFQSDLLKTKSISNKLPRFLNKNSKTTYSSLAQFGITII